MSIIKSTNKNMTILGLGVLASSLVLLILSIEATDLQVSAASKATHATNLASMNNNLTGFDTLQMNLNNRISNNSDSINSDSISSNKLVSIVPLNENQRPVQIDSKLLKSLESNKTLGNLSSILNDGDPSGTCYILNGNISDYFGIDEQTPCTVTLSNNNKTISIDFDYEVILNDDTNRISKDTHNYQQPSNVVLQPGELFVFSRTGGEDYDGLDVYLVDSNVEDGNIIDLDSNEFARVFLDHFKSSGTDFFMVPTIDDGFSTWKLVIKYENNDELESYFIADNVSIEE